MKVVVTGADGFLGWHVLARLRAEGIHDETPLGRGSFNDPARLAAAVSEADVVMHLAGVNRAAPDVVERGNAELADRLVAALEAAYATPRVVYANSVQSVNASPYGRGKQQAAAILRRWTRDRKAVLVEVLLPNLFGEGGRPDYNSFVATFCHRLATSGEPRVDVDKEVDLLHAQEAAAVLISAVDDEAEEVVRPGGTSRKVSDVLAILRTIDATYRTGRIPDLSHPITRQLFTTYRSYLYPQWYPQPLKAATDSRGTFVEVAQALGGQGQTSFSTTVPGVTRGNHFHLRKTERFVVLAGRATIALRPVCGTTVTTFEVSGQQPVFVDMPTLHTHNITNTGDEELLTLFWIDEIYDPADPDTFAEAVT